MKIKQNQQIVSKIIQNPENKQLFIALLYFRYQITIQFDL